VPPTFGEHTAHALRRDLGFSDEQIEALRGLCVIDRAAESEAST
jgi:crotonobetainyl-CoA:carnitine CoA-transferase CaiB-like acyl-CoA transferase